MRAMRGWERGPLSSEQAHDLAGPSPLYKLCGEGEASSVISGSKGGVPLHIMEAVSKVSYA